MANLKAFCGDLVRAIAVLSMVLFALTQAFPTAAAAGPSSVASVAVATTGLVSSAFCGGGEHGDLSHGACHACRFGAAVLPSPPCSAELVIFASHPVVYASLTPIAGPGQRDAPASARGPPLV